MADKKKIGASIVLDGEKEFKSAVTDCNKKLTSMRSELGLVKEKYAENANSMEALSAKHDILSKTLQIQKEKLDATRVGYEHAVSGQKKVENGLSQLKSSYQVAQEKMEQMKRSADVTDKELSQQEKLMKELSDAIKKGEDNYQRATDRINTWKNKLNTAETQVIKANRAVKENSSYMEEARKSTNNCATSIDKYGKKVREITVNVSEVGKESDVAFGALANQIVASGVAEKAKDVADALYDCAKAAGEFETASAKVSTIADTSKVSMEELNKGMLRVSSETGEAVSGIAESTYQAISASIDTTKAVDTVEAATKAAIGGFTDSETTIDGLTTVMNSYKDKVKDATEVSDVFITVQKLGKTSFGELSSSIGKVATNAANYNVSVQNLGTAYVELTKRGIATAEATTYIKSLLKELSKNGSETSKILMNKTGKTFAELSDEGKTLADVIKILSDSVGGNATEFSNLFSTQEAGTAATILMKTGTEEYNATLKEVTESAGATEEAYQKMADTSDYAKQKLLNGISNLKIAIGTELNKSLDGLYEKGGNVIKWATDFVNKNPEVVKAVAVLSAGVVGLTTAFTVYTVATRVLIPLVHSFNAALAANPLGMVATALATLIPLLMSFKSVTNDANSETNKEISANQKATKVLEEKRNEIQKTIDVSKENLSTTTKECETVQTLTDRLKQLNPIQNKTAAQKAEIQRISEQLKDKIPEIAAAYDKETGSIKLTNNQLTRLADNYVNVAMQAAAAKQVQDAANAAFEAEMKLEDAKSKADTTKAEADKAEKRYEKIRAEMEKAYGSVKELNKAKAEYNDAKKAADSAANEVKKYQKTIDDANKTMEKANKLRDEYAKKLEISGKKEKNNGDNSKKAAQEYEKLSETFNTAMSKMGKSGYKVSKNIGDEFEKTVKIAKQTGTKVPKGLAAGLKNGSKSPETAVQTLRKAINKNLLQLASNARKQGAYIPEELTEGIYANKEDPVKAYEQINKEIKRRAESMQKKLDKVGINISDGMRKSFEKGGQNALDAINEANARINKLMNTAGVNSVQGLLKGVNAKKPAVIKAYMDLGDAADKAFKKKLDIRSPSRVFKKSGVYTVDGLIKGIESRKAYLKKTADELGEILITRLQNKIDMKDLKTNGHGYNEKTITKYWNGVVKATKKGTSAHTEALKRYYEARNDLKNKKNEILRDYKSTYKEYISDLKNSIKELNQTYKESVSSTKQSIMSSYSLFSDVKITKTDDANGLIVNLQRQVEAIDSWRKNLQKLRDRGVSESLISEIEALGVASAGDVETLASMSDKQLKQYQSYYNKKSSLAGAEAKKENEALKKQTDSKIKQLDAKFSKKIANLTKKRNREMKALGLSLAKKFTEGIISGSSSAQKAIENMTGQKGKKVKKSSSSSKSISGKIKEYSSSKFVSNAIAGYSGLGYVQNLQKETRSLTDIIRKSLPTKDSIPSATARVNKGVVNNPNAEPVQLNLLMDSKMVASATFNHLDLMQGANIRLLQRGVSR